MRRHIALLRGINVSGRNKIAMSELKACIMALGFSGVTTHLNSGNIIFSSDETEETILVDQIQSAIQERFHMDIPVFVIWQEELVDILNHAPDWWGTDDKEIYDNLIFMMPPLLYTEFYEEIGQPKEEYERVYYYNKAIFWSFSRGNYKKTNWWSKTANAKVSQKITVRTANTVRKIVEL